VIKHDSEIKSAAMAPQASMQTISAIVEAISEALEVVQELGHRELNEIIADIAVHGDLEELRVLAATGNEQISAIQAIFNRIVEQGNAEYVYFRESRRFRPEVVEQRLAEFREQHSAEAAVAWAAEVVEALVRHELKAARQLVEGYSDVDAISASAHREIARGIRRWMDGDTLAAADIANRLWETIGEEEWLPAETKIGLVVLGATAEHQAGRIYEAATRLDAALQKLPTSATLAAERAGLSLMLGDFDDSSEHARRAVELAPGNPEGYFHLGACSEQAGDTAEALELYKEGCALSSILTLNRLGTGATFLRVTGLLHFARARRLDEISHVHESLRAIDDALAKGLNSADRCPDAPAHEFRAKLLSGIGRSHDATEAALKAGQEYLLNGAVQRALPLLERAWDAVPPIKDAGWHLAHALCVASWPSGISAPDQECVKRAGRVWEEQVERCGFPTADQAWAYRVRASISELLGHAQDTDYMAACWEALVYIEKALVLDSSDAGNWGSCSRLLRRLAMENAALECADRGFELDPDNHEVLKERLALLLDSGQYADADEMRSRITGSDSDPWLLGAHAWLLYHQNRYEEAIRALDRSLPEEYDPGWSLELRASCLVRVGRLSEARADLERLLDRDFNMGSQSTLRRAIAHAALGNPLAARQELDSIKSGDPISLTELAKANVAVYLASHNLASASSLAERCLDNAANLREAEDALSVWRYCLALLADRGSDFADEVRMVEELASRYRSRQQPPLGQDVATEITRAKEQHAAEPPESPPRIALSAMTARRMLAGSGDSAQAEIILRELEGTWFAPEAGIAVAGVLRRRLANAVSAGDQRQARYLYKALVDRGVDLPSPVEMVIAEALAAKKRYREAIGILDSARARMLTEGGVVAPVDKRIGQYALRDGDTGASLAAFSRALDAARAEEDWLSKAQVNVWMAIAFAIRGELGPTTDHLADALRDLQHVGAAAPSLVVAHELAIATETAAAPSALGSLSESLSQAIERVDPLDKIGYEWLDAVGTRPRTPQW